MKMVAYRELSAVGAAFGLIAASACAQTKGDGKTIAAAVEQTESSGEPSVGQADAASIGSARMKPDGTIVLQLRATDPASGAIGDAQFEYPPGHPHYEEVLKHIGGLKPGEEKPVPPWP
jgi:hypothetical protein